MDVYSSLVCVIDHVGNLTRSIYIAITDNIAKMETFAVKSIFYRHFDTKSQILLSKTSPSVHLTYFWQ